MMRFILLVVISCVLGTLIGFAAALEGEPGIVSRRAFVVLVQVCSASWALSIYAFLSLVLKFRSRNSGKRASSIGRHFVLTISLILCSILLTINSCDAPRPSEVQAACSYRMKNIARAIDHYYAEHGHYPPAYTTDNKHGYRHSWRVLILPYLEQRKLYDRYNFDEPWNGPHNALLASRISEVYRCPSKRNGLKNESDYVFVTGKGTTFDEGRSMKSEDILDGTDRTGVLVEASFLRTVWTIPRDLDIDDINQLLTHIGNHDDDVQVAFLDGSVGAFKRDKIGLDRLRKLFLISDDPNVRSHLEPLERE